MPASQTPLREDHLYTTMARFAGNWKMEKSENFDDFMKAVGVGLVMRKMGNSAKPSQHITVEGDQWTLKTTSTFKNTEIKFKLGEAFDETTADGRKVKTTMSMDGDNKLVQTQEHKEHPAVMTRELTDDNNMVMACQAGDVIARRYYSKN